MKGTKNKKKNRDNNNSGKVRKLSHNHNSRAKNTEGKVGKWRGKVTF